MKFVFPAALSMVAAAVLAGPPAQADAWNFAFNQGVAEYSVGSFADEGDSLSLSCAEAGVAPGGVEVRVRRAHFKPGLHEPVMFSAGKRKVAMFTDAEGAVRYGSVAAAPRFRALWQLLRAGGTVRVSFGPGAPLAFTLAGAAKLLGPVPCPKQLAG